MRGTALRESAKAKESRERGRSAKVKRWKEMVSEGKAGFCVAVICRGIVQRGTDKLSMNEKARIC